MLGHSEAIGMWDRLFTKYKDGRVLVSPAVSWSKFEDGGSGAQWLDQFMRGCRDCAGVEIAAHWYGDAAWTAAFKTW